MCTEQPSLFGSDSPADWQSQLRDILTRTLHLVRTAYNDGAQLTEAELEDALRLVRRVTDELRVIESDDDVPF